MLLAKYCGQHVWQNATGNMLLEEYWGQTLLARLYCQNAGKMMLEKCCL